MREVFKRAAEAEGALSPPEPVCVFRLAYSSPKLTFVHSVGRTSREKIDSRAFVRNVCGQLREKVPRTSADMAQVLKPVAIVRGRSLPANGNWEDHVDAQFLRALPGAPSRSQRSWAPSEVDNSVAALPSLRAINPRYQPPAASSPKTSSSAPPDA